MKKINYLSRELIAKKQHVAFFKIHSQNRAILLTAYFLAFFFRFVELIAWGVQNGWSFDWLSWELLGFFVDFSVVSGISFLYFLATKRSPSKVLNVMIPLALLGVFSVAHFLILLFFLHERSLLDVFLFQYPIEEIYFTVTTADLPIRQIFGVFIFLLIFPWLIHLFFQKSGRNKAPSKRWKQVLISGSVLWLLSFFIPENSSTKFLLNKSHFFYQQSLHYLAFDRQDYTDLSADDIAFYQSLNPHKEFVSSQYPLVHKRSLNNRLFEQMNRFESSPNIVYVIVEGLHDDYINGYQDLELMPFLDSLKNESLYWKNCFTLGERSFAVVGNSLGGLPYGDLGFTLLEKYPRHHSLVNLLSAKNYHTAFYTGQGKWFHQNGAFFEKNNVTKVYDQNDFGAHYESRKVIVGKEHYFWGYDDKDLFSFYFENMKKPLNQPYFTTFFTGSTHSPFMISDSEYYIQKIEQLKNNTNSKFINTYKKYLKTIPFLDDALQDFFETYKKRPDYENTIFIITGDHPMTEIPRGGELKKYHVPLLIYSPKLKSPQKYTHFVSHLDVSTTLLTFLENYTACFPSETASLGFSLFEDAETVARKYVFMDGNRGMYEYYSDGYFLSKDQLFYVEDDWNLVKKKDKTLRNQLQKELENFKRINYATSFNNLLLDNSTYVQGWNREILVENSHSERIQNKDEFINLTSSELIVEDALNIELNLKNLRKADDKACIVVEVKNERGEVVFWENTLLSAKGMKQLRTKFTPQESSSEKMKLSCYIWNPNHIFIEVTDFDLLAY